MLRLRETLKRRQNESGSTTDYSGTAPKLVAQILATWVKKGLAGK
jgi:hypothetical protein